MGLFDFLSDNNTDDVVDDTCPLEENAEDGWAEYFGSSAEEAQAIEEDNGYCRSQCQQNGRDCGDCMGE